jgi:predicted metal-dependent enzyme (double-stranded beta helix superfamily)
MDSLTMVRTALDDLVAGLDRTMAAPLEARHAYVSDLLPHFLGRADLLPEDACRPGEDRYARHLLHADPAGRYALLAIVWSGGQASPIHAHRVWCAFGVHAGAVEERWYAAAPGSQAPVETGRRLRRPGEVSAAGPGMASIHRVAHAGTGPAVTLHVYGAAAGATCDVNHVLG